MPETLQGMANNFDTETERLFAPYLTVHDPVFLTDKNSLVLIANNAFSKLTGYKDPAGKPVTHLINTSSGGEVFTLPGTYSFACSPGNTFSITRIHFPELEVYLNVCKKIHSDINVPLKNFEHYKQIFDTSSHPVTRFDKDLKHIYMNPAALEYTGLKAEQILGKTHKELPVPKELAEHFTNQLQQVFEKGKPLVSKTIHPTHSGFQHSETFLIPEVAEDGKVIAVYATEKPTSESKGNVNECRLRILSLVAELVVKKTPTYRLFQITLQQLSSAIKGSNCAILKYDPEANCCNIYEKTSTTEILQVPCEEKSLSSAILNSSKPFVVEDFYNDDRFIPSPKLIQTKAKSGVFIRIKAKGRVPFGILGIFFYREKSNFSEGFLLFLQNLVNLIATAMESREDEKALKNSEKSYRDLFNKSGDIKFILDTRGNLLDINKAGLLFFKLRKKEFKEFFPNFTGRHELYVFYKAHLKAIKGKKQYLSFWFNQPDGARRFLDFNIRKCTYFGEVATIVSARDITERKNAELRLEQRNHDLNTFIYKVSHDLKGPLASVLGLVNVAMLDRSNVNTDEYFQMIRKTVEKLDHKLVDLLELTRIQNATQYKDIISLQEVVNDILESITNYSGIEEVRIINNVPNDIRIKTNHQILYSILLNLIINGIKYRNPHQQASYLKISAETKGSRVSLEVADNGIGIHESLHKKIFDMFFRGHETSSGSGLGLFIVKNAVEKLKGTIRLQSERMKGSRFIVELPC